MQGANTAWAVLHHTLLGFLSQLHVLSSHAPLQGAVLHPVIRAGAQTPAGHKSMRTGPAWRKRIHVSWVFPLQSFPVAAWMHSWAFIFVKGRWTCDLDCEFVLDNIFFPWTESAQERLMERRWKSIGQGRRCGAFSSPLSTLGSGNPWDQGDSAVLPGCSLCPLCSCFPLACACRALPAFLPDTLVISLMLNYPKGCASTSPCLRVTSALFCAPHNGVL